jgi:hypothetical protein
MLKPVTEAEKAKFTLRLQFDRAVQELLSEAYEAGYKGYLDIWPEMSTKDKQLVMTVQSSKATFASSALSNSDAIRYHVVPAKGCKRIK